MRCEDITADAADYLAGTLPDERMEDIRSHAATCASCQGELAALDHTWQMLGIVAVPRPDSTKMRARFEAMLDGYDAGLLQRPAVGKAGEFLTKWWQPYRVLQVACAAALVLIGVALGRQSAPTRSTTVPEDQLIALRQEVVDMRQMVTMSLLQQQSATERLEGVAWTSRIERPGAEVVTALLDTLMHDPNVNVRLASIDALKRFANQDVVQRGTLDSLPRQVSPLVQIALIDFVLESAGPGSAAALRRLSQDTTVDGSVRMRAALALAQMEAAS